MSDDLNIDLDLRQTTPDELDGANVLVPKGKHHILVTAAQKRSDDNKYSLRFSYHILASTDPVAVGLTSRESFGLSDAAQWRLRILANRMGFVSEADLGQKKAVPWGQMIGREMIVEVIHEEFTSRDGQQRTASKWGAAGFWDIGDERVESAPKDRAAAAALRQKLLTKKATPAGANSTASAGAASATGTPNYPSVGGGTPGKQGGKPAGATGYI